jgi:hypothetical protein
LGGRSWCARFVGARARSPAEIEAKSVSLIFPIALSNSSSLMDRRTSCFSRCSASRECGASGSAAVFG